MDFFRYREGRLWVEEVDVERIASEVGTPAYIYSKATLADHLHKIQEAYKELETVICFSVKACGNVNILRFLAGEGSGFDIVSGGELYRALRAGADPSRIVYAGVGKTDTEILDALNAGIGYFNVESEQESTAPTPFSPRERRKRSSAWISKGRSRSSIDMATTARWTFAPFTFI